MGSGLILRDALGLGPHPRLAAVGAGGKTTFLLQLAREYAPNVILTTSTHLAVEQAAKADTHLILHSKNEIEDIFHKGIHDFTLITGEEVGEGRLAGLPLEWLAIIANLAGEAGLAVLVEADGSRRLPIKAPDSHEPAIPSWVKEVVVSVGLNALGMPIDRDHVHRPEILARLTDQELASTITSSTISRLLLDPFGGLQNIPSNARNIALLNQADDELRQAAGGRIARELLGFYDTILITSLENTIEPVKAVFAPTAAIILAAGKSMRLDGGQKVLLDWLGQPFVRHIAMTAIDAHLDPVIVITGSQSAAVRQVLAGLPVNIVENIDWESGQSTSILSGVRHLPDKVRAAIFLLADQPQVTSIMLSALVEKHWQSNAPIIAPLVEDRRANPVLFDRATFPHLLELRGDTGGRTIFSKFQVEYMPWFDRLMLLDVDTQEDYARLLTAYGARYEE